MRIASENEPTNPGLWEKVQDLAKGEKASITVKGKTVNGPNDGKGFTVFPSAYANGWSSKVYKDLGGGWKKKAGWWKSESGITGDGPADAMQEAVDTIRSMYLDHPEIDREPTLSELWDTLGFVTGPGVESGEIRVKMAAETGDGSEHVGVFAPLPSEIASQFPTKEEDSSRPHVTLCYIGPVPDKQDQEALVEAVSDLYAEVVGPIKARLSGVDYFRSATGSVAYTKVVFSKDMGSLKDRLKSLLEDRGVEVHDQHPLAFNPHVTLAYYDDPHAVWDGPVPKGSWTFKEVEVWGLPEVRRLPVGSKTYKDLGGGWRKKASVGKHTLPPLPYAYDALEPHISEETLRFHHDKHHQAYVDGLNNAEKSLAEAREFGDYDAVPALNRVLEFNAGGNFLHTLYWTSLLPTGLYSPPSEGLVGAVRKDFGSWGSFRAQFKESAVKVRGSGWGVLVSTPSGMRILTVMNHENGVLWDGVGLLPMDAWEHAYYLDYQNDRGAYFDAVFDNLINWAEVEQRLLKSRSAQRVASRYSTLAVAGLS